MPGSIKGRGAAVQPANPYQTVRLETDFEQVAEDAEYLAQLGRPPTEYLPDESQSIVTENDSPDVGFRYSVNPYRGCSHGCSYCYARPTHEYLGLSAGLGFRDQGHGEVPRGRAAARFPRPAQLAAGDHRLLRRHRLLPAGRTRVPPHARLLGGRGRVPPAGRHHHEKRPGRSRDIDVLTRARRASRRSCVALDHDARCAAGAHDGAAHQLHRSADFVRFAN